MPRRSLSVTIASALLATASASFIGSASGQTAQNISTFSSTAPKTCRQVSKNDPEDGGGVRVCPGPSGLVVVVSEIDSRETVSVGRNRKAAEKEPAATAYFEPLSWTTTTIEWRRTAKDQPPFALIQGWNFADVEDEGKDGRPKTKQILAVTRLTPGAVCHVAYIDVTANADAIELIRNAADTLARDFKCGTDKVKIIGATGRAVELAHP